MKFQKRRPRRAPHYGPVARQAMRDQMFIEIGKALAAGKSTDDISKAYDVASRPVR